MTEVFKWGGLEVVPVSSSSGDHFLQFGQGKDFSAPLGRPEVLELIDVLTTWTQHRKPVPEYGAKAEAPEEPPVFEGFNDFDGEREAMEQSADSLRGISHALRFIAENWGRR